MSEQRTDDWFAARCGKFTGSRFADLFAVSKKDGKPLKAYTDLIWQIVVERMTGQPIQGFSSAATAWGTDVEPFALEAFELETGLTVMETGFVQHPLLECVGASPDGLIGTDSGLEIKSPKNPAIHLERFLSGVPDEYTAQIQGCMWVTGRQTWYFCSYDPRMPPSHRTLIIPVQRDEAYIERLEAAVLKAETEVLALIEELNLKAA